MFLRTHKKDDKQNIQFTCYFGKTFSMFLYVNLNLDFQAKKKFIFNIDFDQLYIFVLKLPRHHQFQLFLEAIGVIISENYFFVLLYNVAD